MKLRTLFPILFLAFPLIADTLDISRSGRTIQLDGFLMDWLEKNRQAWNGSADWHWDAINTREGVAGYLHTNTAARCSTLTVYVDFGRGQRALTASRSMIEENSLYRVVSDSSQGMAALTVEWLFPWDSLRTSENGDYLVKIAAMSDCGEQLDPQVFRGSVPISRSGSILPSHFSLQLAAIIVLLVVFIVLQYKFSRKKRRRI